MIKLFCKKRMVAVGLAAMMLVGLTACGGDSSTKKTGTASDEVDSKLEITAYGVIDPQVSAQQIIADKKGYFKEEGLNLTNKLIQSGTDMPALISGGDAQVSFESANTAITCAANGVNVKVVSCVSDAGDTQCVVAGKNSGIESAKDMEGKKMGVSAGAAVLVAVQNMCKELDVDYDKIEKVTLGPSDQIASLEKGDIDMMACWEPWVTTAEKEGGKLLFSGLQSYFPEKEGDVDWLSFECTFQVRGEFLEEHPAEVKAILRALKKATEYINEHPEEAAKIVAKEIKQNEDTVLAIMKKNHYKMEMDDSFKKATNDVAAFMKDTGDIDKVPEYSDYNDASLVKEVLGTK